ncbi:S-layer homology domain-containing protein [Cohnella sp. CBP 2801]|uniref:S-layer homology domain-containing protein n=2 Tax=Cohnella zeiphila TaxID=2761120 RepID=A0A7X0SQG0_9BACL|nr:S-layer homology domain-containing protein [Cohnella zeiphila]
MEYRASGESAWTAITGTSVTELAPGTYDVRTKATGSAFASATTSVTIGAATATPETTPAASIDYASEELIGLTPGVSYTINGESQTADVSGKLSLDSSWLGTTLSIVKVGNGTTTTDSEAQSLAVPSRAGAPTGVGKTDETVVGASDGSITSVTSAMEYRASGESEWTAITGTSVTELAPGTYDVRTKATGSAFASAETSVTIDAATTSPEAKPAATVDYANEKLTGLTPGAAYTVSGESQTADENGELALDSSWLGTTLSIVKVGSGTTTDSAAQSLAVPSRADAPTGVGKTDETAVGASDGFITSVTSEMEYRASGESEWTAITGTSVTGLAPGTYDVRTKATGSAFASAETSVTIAAATATPETTPAANIDYANEELIGLTPGASYTINGESQTADVSGKLSLDSSWLGTTLSIVKVGNGTTTTDSEAQSLAVPSRAGAPTGVGKTDETVVGASDGSIRSVTSAMEYRASGESAWTAITGTSVTELAPGTYDVRTKATGSAFASAATSVTIAAATSTPETTPAASIDYANEELIGLTPGASYTINGESQTADVSGKLSLDNSWLGTTLSIVKVGNGTTTTDSAAQSLVIARRPSVPSVSADDESNLIVGLNTTMEFSVDNGAYMKYDGTNPPNLSGAHSVKVRLAATASAPSSYEATLIYMADSAVGLTISSSDPRGAANDGKTKLEVTETLPAGHKLVYFNFGSGPVVVPKVGDALTGYSNLPDSRVVPASNGDMFGVAEVDADGKVVHFGQAIANVVVEPIVVTDPGTSVPTQNAGSGTSQSDVVVLVNGKVENAGRATTTTVNNQTVTTVAVDPDKLNEKLAAEGNNAVVTIPVNSGSDVVIGELTAQMVKNMEQKQAVVQIKTPQATYSLPANQINVDSISSQLGQTANLEDIKIRIQIAAPSAEAAKAAEDAASAGGFTPVVTPVEFTVKGTYNGQTVEVSRFNSYVERTIAIPDGVDPGKITTGIVIDPDGTVRHVPTKISRIEGKYYAVINSLTNSLYSVVWHPIEFQDVENHWAQNAVNDMGSRMIVDGTGNGLFSPDRSMTRAEFAAMIVRALGLKVESGLSTFADVSASAWYVGAVQTAYDYKLINGFGDGLFHPMEEITREQAMAIIDKAMAITGLQAQFRQVDADTLLRPFADAAKVSSWAKEDVARSLQAGVVTGRNGHELDPQASITRAEIAAMIQRLLQKSDLI